MPPSAIEFDGVWKKFRRGERHDSLRDLIPSVIRRLTGTAPARDLQELEFWAVKNVSFRVNAGEALGIIGPNGAGKSTVLKLLTKILKPTMGRCEIRGRTGALIELAAGFHPDLTGRENVYLQGAIMGMRRAEIAERFDRIIEFAGVTDFVDTPVKRYSSGMNARLGFAIAAYLEPEVLLIDEVLAVGDAAFQERCFGRMSEFRREGVAIVFVSHNLSAIKTICDQVLVLRSGEPQCISPPGEAFAKYAELLHAGTSGRGSDQSHEVVVEVCDGEGRRVESVEAGNALVVRALVRLARQTSALASGLRIRTMDTGDVVFYTTSTIVGDLPVVQRPGDAVEIRWSMTANLARAHYSIELVLFDAQTEEIVLRLNPAAHFGVVEDRTGAGVAYLDAKCSTVVGQPLGAAR